VAKETQTSEQRETNATVVVSVTDVNDNAPLFAQSTYEVSVGESSTFPVPVGTVSYYFFCNWSSSLSSSSTSS
jgi:hypothetical protein